MKRLTKKMATALLTAIMAVCSLAVSPKVNAAQNYADAELARAVELGFGAYKADNPAVTFAEFFTMLDKTIEFVDNSKPAAWRQLLPEARKSAEKITRFNAMVAVVYTAAFLGEEYLDFNTEWATVNEKIGAPWDKCVANPKLFGAFLSQPIAKVGFTRDSYVYDWDYSTLAYFYGMGRASLTTDKSIFDYDSNKNSMRPEETLKYSEALLAALRLYDSGLPMERWPNAEDAKIVEAAEKRKQAILNSPTNVTVKGTKYYVSNSGNDDNDGLTPQTAWKTLDKVNSATVDEAADFWKEYDWARANPDKCITLKPGDGVFFERGGLWRGVLRCAKGVTYSAYGTGDKPKIYGAPENGVGAEKWSLVPGTKNIWVFYKELNEVGGITFENDQTAFKYLAFWSGTRYVDTGNRVFTAASEGYDLDKVLNTPYDVKTLKDNWFFSETIYPGKVVESDDTYDDLYRKGKLYLSSDKGNPGAIHSFMEFNVCQGGDTFLLCNEGSVVDNLCLMYSSLGIGGHDYENWTVQNCEIARMGGGVVVYEDTRTDESRFVMENDHKLYSNIVGGDLQLAQHTGAKALNNYIHNQWDNAISVEHVGGSDHTMGQLQKVSRDKVIRGNLIVSCTYGIVVNDILGFQNGDTVTFVKDLMIEDNMVMYTGMYNDWAHGGWDFLYAVALHISLPRGSNSMTIKNNVFYMIANENQLIAFGKRSDENNKITLSGNTYVVNNGETILEHYPKGEIDERPRYYYKDVEKIEAILGDKTSKVIAPSFAPPDLSAWAKESVKTAILRGLATAELQKGYQSATTRAEFCRAAVNFLEKFYGKPVADILKERKLTAKTFADTQDAAICAAAALGIAGATDAGKNTFSPNITLTREVGASMMYGLVKATGAKIDVKDVAWSDANDISAWAKDGVNAMCAAGIMGSTETGKLTFSPKTAYPHEQCVANLNKLWEYLKK